MSKKSHPGDGGFQAGVKGGGYQYEPRRDIFALLRDVTRRFIKTKPTGQTFK
jgi:hypothetical protein